jgi:cation diffusion facilitator family transporter
VTAADTHSPADSPADSHPAQGASPGARSSPQAPSTAGAFTPGEAKQARRLKMVLGMVSGFFVLELAGALWAESVVLQADALHLLMDVLALAASLLAMRLAVRRPTPRFTYGLRRAEPVAAIVSALLVLVTTAGIVFEGVEALDSRAMPRAGIMLAVALMALVVNGVSAWLLHDAIGHAHPHPHDPDNPDAHAGHAHARRDAPAAHDHAGHDHAGHDHAAHADSVHAAHAEPAGHDPTAHDHAAHADPDPGGHDHAHDASPGRTTKEAPHAARSAHAKAKAQGHALNLRGAWLHLMGDALGALAAIGAALVIRFGGPVAADPIASFVVAAILLVGAVRLLRDAVRVLLESAPAHLPVRTIREYILTSPGVVALHDLHVWTLGAGHDAVTVHVRTDATDPTFGQCLSESIRTELGVEYVTVQVEVQGGPCGAPSEAREAELGELPRARGAATATAVAAAAQSEPGSTSS